MIDPHWVLEDLDPRTWLAIGRFFMPDRYIAAAQPGERGLFVLHDGGRPTRVFDTRRGTRTDLATGAIDDPTALARELHARGEWDRVHVIDRRHLAHVARTAQAFPRRELTLDAYYHLVYGLIWDGSDGYVALPPHPGAWQGWTYGGLRHAFKALPSPSALGLCVIEGEQVEIGLVVKVDNGRITRVTTFEGLSEITVARGVNQSFFDALWSKLDAEIAPPAAALVCSSETFEAWLSATDKLAALRAGSAVFRF